MQQFRRAVLPILYLVVFAVIAVSLAWLAFAPGDEGTADDASATGELIGAEVVAQRSAIDASVTVDGSIAIAEPVAAKPDRDGTINHIWVEPGTRVSEGDELFQIVVEEPADTTRPEAGDDAEANDSEADADGGADAADPAEHARERSYHTVTAPVDGTVGALSVEVGDDLAKGDEGLTVTPPDYSAAADIDPVELYRLGDLPETAEVTITGGPAPFECTGLRLFEAGAPPAPSGAGSADDPDSAVEGPEGMDPYAEEDSGSVDASGGSTSLSCAVPEDVEVYNGLTVSLTVAVGSAEDALTVPVTAVRGMDEDATVWVVDEAGEAAERDVEIGLSDGAIAEVVSGLEEGEALLEYVPGTEPEVDEDMEFAW